jgi:hypothetical protein
MIGNLRSMVNLRWGIRDSQGGLLSAFDMRERWAHLERSGAVESMESQYQGILRKFCTPKERFLSVLASSTLEHHAELERITDVKLVDQKTAMVWTHYEPEESNPRDRRYVLELCDGMWLIDQHYLIDDDHEDFPEL